MKAKGLSKQRLSKARRMDRITKLPRAITETILCLLPIEEAARTSILSKEWRYKWTTIPKLVFLHSAVKRPSEEKHLDWWNVSDLEEARREKEWRCKLFCAIHQILLLRQAPILDFTLSMNADRAYFEIDQIILHLLKNHTVKKLTLDFYYRSSYRLPLSFFSLHHLTDLYLGYCHIYPKPTFNGFDNLTSLSLSRICISRKTLLHLLSKCPSLKSLELFILEEQLYGKERPNIMELFKSLPAIEHLTTWGYITTSFVLNSVPQALPSSLIHLKCFCFKEMGIIDCNGLAFGLTFLLVLLKCSPNLEKVKLEINTDEDFDEESVKLEEYSVIFEEYLDVRLEHLNELEFEGFSIVKPTELELVKFVLARSPKLKKVILPTYISNKDEELVLLQTLLRAPRASPVEILVENRCKYKR